VRSPQRLIEPSPTALDLLEVVLSVALSSINAAADLATLAAAGDFFLWPYDD
jgi:hypothetical protein